MTCYYPRTGYRARYPNESGKYSTVYDLKQGYIDMPRVHACGQCAGCRLRYSYDWAVRCMHEASLHDRNSFITVTYATEYLPPYGTLVKKDFTDFLKRLRDRVDRNYGQKIRFYYCGEYGEKLGRPHYHACVFGLDFHQDRYRIEDSKGGHPQWMSDLLSSAWGMGRATIGELNFDSAGYVARYIVKKVTGKAAAEHYRRVDVNTGEEIQLLPEYTDMSRGGRKGKGIAYEWFKANCNDVYPSDTVIVKQKPRKPPRYYDSQFEIMNPDDFDKVKFARKKHAKYLLEANPSEFTVERMHVKAQVKEKVISNKLIRGLERDL